MEQTNLNQAAQTPHAGQAQPAPQAQSELAAQLGKLQENIDALLKSVVDSSQRQKIEKQITAMLEQANKQLNQAREQANVDAAVRQARQRAEKAWTTAHGPQIVHEMKGGLHDTLKAVYEGLRAACPILQSGKDKPQAEMAKAVEETKEAAKEVAETVAAKVEDIKPAGA